MPWQRGHILRLRRTVSEHGARAEVTEELERTLRRSALAGEVRPFQILTPRMRPE